ncbi:MAG: alpha/beta fold hydrolase [Burkholderiaceae bacterium]|nr:alpha/beta fold hydrolase [Rhodoferax sp.]MCB2008496.1 alpha/beta fold hydrolase [Rhodoferax sp.]MCB2028591.1 alpha/beta fold hydrolase [Rhodoferax sp.]MCB2040487.1 alpha/beta fold hydrolase [Rhodoferax sp.]MCP5262355.1 alpha/beta fold hydrolase [Rhodoferax sp.]
MQGSIGDLPLECGAVLPAVELAYVTYGTLAPDGRNAVLLTHGYTSSHLFADGGEGSSEGSWASLVGPGRAIDTDRYFVVSSNMLGSAFGSTGPRSIDPRSGREYGPDFPAITLRDIVTAQKRLLEQLGVTHLAAVAGPSYGGFQGFAWGVIFPDFVDRLAIAVSAPRRPANMNTARTAQRLATDPNWNGGHYYRAGGIDATMTAIREETLRGYGLEQELAPRFPDARARAQEITRIARGWAQAFDGHSLLVLGHAAEAFDATGLLGRITARVLYVLSRTDALFPPSLAPGVMAALTAAGVDARYVEIDSEHGHLASGTDAAKWAPALAELMR